jgi:hypothetical protein
MMLLKIRERSSADDTSHRMRQEGDLGQRRTRAIMRYMIVDFFS